MHEYRRFVEREMDKRQWNPNQVAQHAGLNRQTVYDIVQDTRESLNRIPSEKTISGLASAFGVGREKILAAVAEAMGLPIQIVRADVSAATNDELMSELSRRLREKAGDGDAEATPTSRAGVSPAAGGDDGLGAFGGRARGDLDNEDINDGTGDNVHELFTPPPPIGIPALDTENRGKKTRKQQDEDAEGTQDPGDDDE
ncbi:MAG: helix-turn-helix transcriptional regulator [Brevibacterium sp.]|nr:helix-turn-helix transcriptional regulator [Brevibacterium sp.]